MKRMSHFVVAVLIVLGAAQLAIADTKDAGPEADRFAAALKHVDELIGVEKLDEAVRFLKELDAKTLKNAAKIDYRLGKVFLRLDRPSKALDHFEHATFSTMDDGEIYVGLAEANLALGNLVRARGHSRTALRTNKDLVGAHVALATIDDRSGQVTAARERFAGLIKNHPNSESVIVAYAQFLSHRNDLDQAIALLTPYLDRMPYAAEASDLLGLLHWMQERRIEAFKYRAIAAKAFKSKGNNFRAEQVVTWLIANDRDGVFRSENRPQVKSETPQEAPRKESRPRASPPIIQAKTLSK